VNEGSLIIALISCFCRFW